MERAEGARRAACRQARPPPLRDRVRRRRRRDHLHARAAHGATPACDVEWRIIQGTTGSSTSRRPSTTVSRGAPERSQRTRRRSFGAVTLENAGLLTDAYDFVIVHDAQPAGDDRHGPPSRRALDLALPHRSLRRRTTTCSTFCCRRSPRYDATIFHLHEYVPQAPGLPPAYIWPPAIDPLAAEEHGTAARRSRLHRRPVRDRRRPAAPDPGLALRPWKDPLGVIDAYRVVKEAHPDVQLALVGSMAHDDPEGWEFYNQTVSTRARIRTSSSSRISTTSARSRSTRSRCIRRRSSRSRFQRGLRPDRLARRSGRRGRGGRPRRRHRHPDRGRRNRLARRPRRRSVPQACREIMADPTKPGGALRGKEHVAELPYPAAAPRLARAVQPRSATRSGAPSSSPPSTAA